MCETVFYKILRTAEIFYAEVQFSSIFHRVLIFDM